MTENELLQDLGISWTVFLDAKRDLRFQLGLQSYKSALAIACYLTVVRAACEPKVRKTHNLVDDQEVLGLASGILREVTTHIIEEMQAAQDSFFAVGDRRAVGEQFRIDRAQKSGRAAPPADAPKGKPLPPTATTKARPKEANAASPPIKPKPGAMKA